MGFFTYHFDSPAQFYSGMTSPTTENAANPTQPVIPLSYLLILTWASIQLLIELSDLLQEGGFHESTESQVNEFISLIVQYQGIKTKSPGLRLDHKWLLPPHPPSAPNRPTWPLCLTILRFRRSSWRQRTQEQPSQPMCPPCEPHSLSMGSIAPRPHFSLLSHYRSL